MSLREDLEQLNDRPASRRGPFVIPNEELCERSTPVQIDRVCDHIGPFIKRRRKELHLTLEEVGRRIGSSKTYVWELEQGKAKNPTVRLVFGLAEALECSLDAVLGVAISQPSVSEKEMSLISAHRRIFDC